MNNNNYSYLLERCRGSATRHVCSQCGRKQVFTRYIDTHNNNVCINDKAGKCNRLDKCGYHYTPRQYFEDNPWLRDNVFLFFLFMGKKKNENEKPPQPERMNGANGANARTVAFVAFVPFA